MTDSWCRPRQPLGVERSALRENISESQAAHGPAIKHDIALPVSRIAAFMAATDEAISRRFNRFAIGVCG
ncbi:MAG TPA: hypothetical protein VNU71_13790 [Burkholderiaceae bacterium]|nr:hypothetical protein [Burkholderiaceae bacterium]